MRTVLFGVFILLPCAPAMASKTTPAPSVHIKNETTLRVRVAVVRGGFVFYGETLEPGDAPDIRLPSGLQVFDVVVSAQTDRPLRTRKSYPAPRDCARITITLADEILHLSDALPCTADPPDPPPQASAPGRESLLAALSSSGLLALAVLGLLINRHE